MKVVKIVTYCTSTSIGSILQAFSLTKTLSNMGYKSELLLERTLKSKHVHFDFKTICRKIFNLTVRKKLSMAKQKRDEFVAEHIDVSYCEGNRCAEGEITDKTSCYLAGSDQIWNPALCNPFFFLDFAKGRKRISYAASMGNTNIPDEEKDDFFRLLDNFDKISVREKNCAEIIRKRVDKKVDVHIDPTFLVDSNEWRNYKKAYNIQEPYILLYMIYWDKSLKRKVKDLKKRTGLKVYTIKNGLSRAYGDKILYDVGINEFLWLVDHAKYIVTSSFHGVAMSIIFNKKFSAVINPNSPSRIENLLGVLKVPYVDIDELDSFEDFQYDIVNQCIISERTRALEYLKEAID